jgi:methylmalonyl-CoA mutase N-terminal domain/subunit
MLEGVYEGIESGWFEARIADSSYEFTQRVNSKQQILVGINDFFEGNEEELPPILQIGHETQARQLERLALTKSKRDENTVIASLERIKVDATSADTNLMPAFIESVRHRATLGEIIATLGEVFGYWKEDPVL